MVTMSCGRICAVDEAVKFFGSKWGGNIFFRLLSAAVAVYMEMLLPFASAADYL